MPREAIQPLTISAFSDEVQEIMARSPHWLLRWGITVVAVILGVLLLVSWMIHYPDVIPAPITLTGANPPVEIVARQSGHLQELRVGPNAAVRQGDILAIIESPVDPSRAFAIRRDLQTLAPLLGSSEGFEAVRFGTEGSLGQLQGSYSEFFSEYNNYRTIFSDDYADKTVALLEGQLERKRSQVANLNIQVEATHRELELAELKYERMKTLNSRDSVSIAQLQEEEGALLARRRQGATVLNELNEEEIAVAGIEKQIRDLKHLRSDDLRDSQARVQAALKRVLAEIEIWEQDYVLKAPIDGKVAFYDFWSDQQFVTAGSQVFVIDPGSTHLLGRMQVKRTGAGKIQPGHLVRIKFDDYPYKEFGIVTGKVRAVSLVAREGAHLVMVDVDYPLTTNFRQVLPFKQQMTGEGSVITQDRRLIGRIFSELFRAVNQSAGE